MLYLAGLCLPFPLQVQCAHLPTLLCVPRGWPVTTSSTVARLWVGVGQWKKVRVFNALAPSQLCEAVGWLQPSNETLSRWYSPNDYSSQIPLIVPSPSHLRSGVVKTPLWTAVPPSLTSLNPVQTGINSHFSKLNNFLLDCATCFLPGPQRMRRRCKEMKRNISLLGLQGTTL